MKKLTTALLGVLAFLFCYSILNLSIGLSIFAGFATIFPDLGIKLKHKKAAHNVWIILIISALAYILLEPLAGVLFLVGSMIHIILSLQTDKGIHFFWPLLKKEICKAEGCLSGKNEHKFQIGLGIACLVFLVLLL